VRSAQAWLDAYGESHRNPVNEILHWICIPCIILSLLGLLASLPSPFANPWLNWGTGLVVLTTLFYARLSIPLALGMAAVGGALLCVMLLGLTQVPLALWQSSLIVFVVAWIGQFIGHQIEGKKPSFFEDLQFLLIGPMWLLAAVYRKLGVRY
jgi:uncharacterized membrane protein YGL010W